MIDGKAYIQQQTSEQENKHWRARQEDMKEGIQAPGGNTGTVS